MNITLVVYYLDLKIKNETSKFDENLLLFDIEFSQELFH